MTCVQNLIQYTTYSSNIVLIFTEEWRAHCKYKVVVMYFSVLFQPQITWSEPHRLDPSSEQNGEWPVHGNSFNELEKLRRKSVYVILFLIHSVFDTYDSCAMTIYDPSVLYCRIPIQKPEDPGTTGHTHSESRTHLWYQVSITGIVLVRNHREIVRHDQ